MTKIEIIRDANMNDLFDAMKAGSRFDLLLDLVAAGWKLDHIEQDFSKKMGDYSACLSIPDRCLGAPAKLSIWDGVTWRFSWLIYDSWKLNLPEIKRLSKKGIEQVKKLKIDNPDPDYVEFIA